MSEMVERVASAILAKVPEGYGMTRAEAAEYARAALQALREPTPHMIYVAEGYCDFMLPSTHDNTGPGRRAEFRMGWQTAIDAALTPAPPEQ